MRHLWLSIMPFLACLGVLDAKEIWDALLAVGIGKEKTEQWTGIDRRQLARQIDGDEWLRHKTLEKFPLSYHQEYHWRMVLKVGLPDRIRRSLPLVLAFESLDKPMAKMSLPETEKEKQTA